MAGMLRRFLPVAALACAALTPPAHAAEFEWSPAGQIGQPRQGAGAVVLGDGRLLMIGGHDPRTGQDTASTELYDPRTNTWSPAPPMLETRAYPSAVRLRDGRVLVLGGQDQADHKSAELFDPATSTWARATSPTAPHANAPAVMLADGRVLFVGGNIYISPYDGGEIYDPVADRWTLTAAMGAARGVSQSVAALRDGRVLVVGGFDAGAAEIYDPRSDVWTPVAPPRDTRSGAGAATLPDGRVLVAGGWASTDGPTLGATARRTAEVFDAGTGAWSPTGDLNRPRDGAPMVTLAGGQPVYVGGWWATIVNRRLGEEFFEPTTEIYDAATGRWTPAAPLVYGRTGHTATLLPDGTLLVAGGVANGVAVTAAERLVPRPPAPPAPPPPTQPPTTQPGPRPGTLAFLRLPKRLKPTRAATIVVRLRCTGGPCSDRLILRGRGRTLAQRSFTAAAGKTITVRLKLGPAARRALRQRTTRVTLSLQRQGAKVRARVRA
jgi:hypothetical protein